MQVYKIWQLQNICNAESGADFLDKRAILVLKSTTLHAVRKGAAYMAKPIKDTPILKGQDAKRFSADIRANETRKVSSAEYKKLMTSYNKFKIK